MPIAVSQNQRVEPIPVSFEEVAKACAPERFVDATHVVPKSRVRQVSPYIEEHYKPVYATAKGSNDLAEIVRAGQTLIGWVITQRPRSPFCDCQKARFGKEDGQMVHRECGRRRAPLSDQEVVERALSAQVQASDEFYRGFYETIPGTASAIIDGVPVTGGTLISSRKDYNEKTKGFVHWDKGTHREVERAKKEQNDKRKADTAKAVERLTHKIVSDRPSEI